MRIPEPLFVIINRAMRILLRSPLHPVASGSLMLISVKGRVTGRTYTTPVRYVEDGEKIRCHTNRDARWWPNLKHDPTAVLRLRGREVVCSARVIDDDPTAVRALLVSYLTQFPGDAVYHDVRLDSDRKPQTKDLDRAASHSIVVELTPVTDP